ncbi:MAG: ATP-binding protein [Candidatus Promineifilaceae bacterium]
MNSRLGSIIQFIRSNLRVKIFLGIMMPLLLILGVSAALDYGRRRDALLEELSNLSAYTGRVVETDLRHQMINSDFEGLQELLDAVGADEELQSVYLLNPSGEVIFSPFERHIGVMLDNNSPECQPCHRLPVEQRPDSIVVTAADGRRVFRSMQPIENSPECGECHDADSPLIGILLIDVAVAPFSETVANYLQSQLLWWLGFILIAVLAVNFVVGRVVLTRLGGMVSSIAGMGHGETRSDLEEGPPDEIGQLVGAFNDMSQRVTNREVQNRRLSERLQRESDQRSELLKLLITAQEDERKRVARDLHDGLGQSLGALALDAEVLKLKLAVDDEPTLEQLDQIQSLIAETTDQMYSILLALRPSALDDLGLLPALRDYCERLLQDKDIQFEFDASGFESRVPPEIETALFRIFQEALNNSVRHAEATHLRLSLSYRDDIIEGLIEDDGRGFDPDSIQINDRSPRGLGLLGMRERAIQCGGQLRLHSAPGQGTRIRISIPLNEVSDV